MYRAIRPKLFLSTLLGITLLAVSGTSLAQYKKTNLVSNLATGRNIRIRSYRMPGDSLMLRAILLDQRRVQWAFRPCMTALA